MKRKSVMRENRFVSLNKLWFNVQAVLIYLTQLHKDFEIQILNGVDLPYSGHFLERAFGITST